MITIDLYKKLHGAEGIIELDVHLHLQKGEFVAIYGESGSGKTTLLRCIAGLQKADASIKVGNELWQSNSFFLPVQKRRIGFVFQEYALFDNMNVLQNLLYVENDKDLARHLLDMTGLLAMEKRYPKSLSGGQQQRLALCRAMMQKPKILLLDEPFSALDSKMRAHLQDELLLLHKEFGTTTVLVSHDPSEIYKLASRVIQIDKGKIIKDATPKEVLLRQQGSQKFAFVGEILEIQKADVIFIAVVSIGQQLVEVVLSADEAKSFKVGERVQVGTKAFAPTLFAIR